MSMAHEGKGKTGTEWPIRCQAGSPAQSSPSSGSRSSYPLAKALLGWSATVPTGAGVRLRASVGGR